MPAAMMRSSTARPLTAASPTKTAKPTQPFTSTGSLCVRVTGLDQKEFTGQFLANKVGDYFYMQDCEVKTVEVLADAVLVTFASHLSVDRAMALDRMHDNQVQAGNKWRPHGRLLCKTGGIIIQRIVPVSPKVAPIPATAGVPTPGPIESSVQATKSGMVPPKRMATHAPKKSAPTKPRPWDPCDTVVAVHVMEGISFEEFQSVLLGVDEVNYKFLNTLPYSEIRYHKDKPEFSIKAKHQSALLRAQELLQDLLEHVKEEVTDRLKTKVNGIHGHEQGENPRPHACNTGISATLGVGLMNVQEQPLVQQKATDDIRAKVVEYNKLAPSGWAVPCGFSTVSKVGGAEDDKSEAGTSTTTVDENKDAKANDDEDSASEVSTTSFESVGVVQVERIVQKTIWTCVCGTMNFRSNFCWCGRMQSDED